MTLLQVGSLRKSAHLLQQAAEELRAGRPVACPCEGGYLRLTARAAADLRLRLALLPPAGSDAVGRAAAAFWPGPLRLRVEPGGPLWQIPAHPLARALLQLWEQPLAAAEWNPHLPQLEPPSWDGVTLAWKEPCLNVAVTEVDAAAPIWRWLRSGLVERRELEWVSGQRCMLSEL